jgi:subtilisin family serine protease
VRARRSLTGVAATAAALTVAVAAAPLPAVADPGAPTEYTVVAADGVSSADAIAAIQRAGGRVVDRNDAVGMFQVVGPQRGFVARTAATRALAGAAHKIPVGHAPRSKPDLVEREGVGAAGPAAASAGAPTAAAPAAGTKAATPGLDPFDDKLWGLRMVRSDQARKIDAGSHKVSVGVLDTGIDASNPDIAPNFDWALSRNFAPDIPLVDGPCEVPSCLDPVGTDDGAHGTHVAGTIGAAANGIGVSGVAPGVDLVELKGGQDSGFFFLAPVVNALTYAASMGIDVVNMSFFLDPWLFNCYVNPADTPEQLTEQRAIILGMSRALSYAHLHGVTLVAALGNEHQDLGNPRTDIVSPDFPPNTEHPRPIDNALCLSLPTEGAWVIGVSALGPSGKKSDFSNYGTEQIEVSAPGGWSRDGFGTPTFRTNANLILSTYPRKVLQEQGRVDAAGNVVPAFANDVLKDCTADGRCGYYAYLQGTSMASPHAAGVAALIVSEYGSKDKRNGGVGLDPKVTERVLRQSATDTACPNPREFHYPEPASATPQYTAFCEGPKSNNGFYGDGIVSAIGAVSHKGKH